MLTGALPLALANANLQRNARVNRTDGHGLPLAVDIACRRRRYPGMRMDCSLDPVCGWSRASVADGSVVDRIDAAGFACRHHEWQSVFVRRRSGIESGVFWILGHSPSISRVAAGSQSYSALISWRIGRQPGLRGPKEGRGDPHLQGWSRAPGRGCAEALGVGGSCQPDHRSLGA